MIADPLWPVRLQAEVRLIFHEAGHPIPDSVFVDRGILFTGADWWVKVTGYPGQARSLLLNWKTTRTPDYLNVNSGVATAHLDHINGIIVLNIAHG